jgi:hypothetical protein
MRRTFFLGFLVLLPVGLAACGTGRGVPVDAADLGDTAESGPDVGDADTALEPDGLDVQVDPPSDDGPPADGGNCERFDLVRTSSGGFSGGGDGRRISITGAGGTAQLQEMPLTVCTGMPPADLLCRIWSALVAIDFFALPVWVAPASNPDCCCDMFAFTINVTNGGRTHEVTFCSASPEWTTLEGPLSDLAAWLRAST